jgi:proteic killer suppression protein
MIVNFKCKETHKIFRGERTWKFPPEILRSARRKLLIIHAAINLNDLRTPPSNHLEKLKGARQSQHSIRINKQWRICFTWENNNAHHIEIVDYHK